ncbi:MAG: prenyltransferase [Desulfobacterales bacterium]
MNNYQKWFLASRPWSFSMTAISVSVGSALAFLDGAFSWPLYLLTLLGMVFMHAATNLINDYYDVRSGVDSSAVSTAQYRPHPLLEGQLELAHVRGVAWCLYGVVAAIGMYLAVSRGWMILLIGLIGFAASFTYTAPPVKYKHRALGEVGVLIMWGPLMVEGAYYVQHGVLSVQAFWVSLPFGVLVALVLLINNVRDIENDRAKGITTLPILIGRKMGLTLYLMLIVIAFLSVVTMAWLGPLQPWSLLVLVSLPLAFQLFRQMIRNVPQDADAQTAKLDTVFGVLLVVSLLLGGLA